MATKERASCSKATKRVLRTSRTAGRLGALESRHRSRRRGRNGARLRARRGDRRGPIRRRPARQDSADRAAIRSSRSATSGRSGAPDSDVVPANAVIARTAFNLGLAVSRAWKPSLPPIRPRAARRRSPTSACCASASRACGIASAHVTARDFEDLALESSPDIVQAHCFVRPGVRASGRGHARKQSAAERRADTRAAPPAARCRCRRH